MSKLETEIKNANKRIQDRQSYIDSELSTLESKITFYTKWAWGFVWSGFVISILSIIYFSCFNTENGFALNLLGDFLGGSVASLWSLAGLFFIYVAFLGQKQQLLNQQLELMYSQLEVKYTRLELAGQREEMEEQNSTLRQQRFEHTFFQLINLFDSIVNSLNLRNRQTKEIVTSGRGCFKVFYRRLRNLLNEVVYGRQTSSDELEGATIEQTLEAYNNFYSNEKSDLSHYFRTIYHIYKFIDKSDIENKKQYSSIARAQLSSYEQILLFYNCQHENGKKKFKFYIEKYAVFKNIDVSLIINKEHLNEYDKSAYGK